MAAQTVVRGTTLVIGAAVVAYLVMLATVTVRWEGDFERFLLLAVVGGVVMAALRLLLKVKDHAPIVTDPFSSGSADIVNISHIRVAGLGGAGLVLASFVVALQYELTTVAMAAGIIGGVLMATAMIVSRRR